MNSWLEYFLIINYKRSFTYDIYLYWGIYVVYSMDSDIENVTCDQTSFLIILNSVKKYILIRLKTTENILNPQFKKKIFFLSVYEIKFKRSGKILEMRAISTIIHNPTQNFIFFLLPWKLFFFVFRTTAKKINIFWERNFLHHRTQHEA